MSDRCRPGSEPDYFDWPAPLELPASLHSCAPAPCQPDSHQWPPQQDSAATGVHATAKAPKAAGGGGTSGPDSSHGPALLGNPATSPCSCAHACCQATPVSSVHCLACTLGESQQPWECKLTVRAPTPASMPTVGPGP